MLRALQRGIPAARGLRRAARPASAGWPSQLPIRVAQSQAFSTTGKHAAATPTPEEDLFEENQNMLEGKRSRDSIHNAFSARAVDAIRYDYFAQRAELEAEMEAASAFRSLTETAKQQAMGYLELMEEYGDAGFGSTVDNIDVAAASERENAEDVYRGAAEVASEEGLEEVQEWFEDMTEASSRAAARLELVSSIIDAESMEGEMMEDDGDDIPDKAKH